MERIEKDLYDAAVQLIETRYPTGWGGAAAVRTQSGKILTSVAPDVKNDALSLCMEVGAYLEAHKLDEAVTHSLCICREDENGDFLVLSPCGICQERLVHWGGDVKAAISNENNKLVFKTIRELMPYHWSLVNGNAL
ncbi:cytidine deaminase [Vibrio alginolyticus]|uniref:cytidine deaminase n=1 Tax=Vibrio TaxID=662 RepID=UPI001435989E|nr:MULTISPECIES: cytidine deaminase [Vibrio]BCB42124.1 cytidine deaminase [Vibrio alginolyticus]NNN55670.1 cytidine deaminase [Vibrio sp. 1-2 (7-a)]BCB46724.1 cytidine deaminase [Vibrio alginolyticus]BCB51325.1 cytidine deaminase [Vibrio alginolyticus]BCB55928.1 cytidine deaminase [Vibrio alginolyticus]